MGSAQSGRSLGYCNWFAWTSPGPSGALWGQQWRPWGVTPMLNEPLAPTSFWRWPSLKLSPFILCCSVGYQVRRLNTMAALGIDPGLLISQIINFGLLFFLLWLILYKPILRLLNKRQIKIQKGLENAAEASKILEVAQKEATSILEDARAQAHTIIEEANREAEAQRLEAINRGAPRSA